MIRLTIHLIAPDTDEAVQLLRRARQEAGALGDRLAEGMPFEALTGSIEWPGARGARMNVHVSGTPDDNTARTWFRAKADQLAKGGEP